MGLRLALGTGPDALPSGSCRFSAPDQGQSGPRSPQSEKYVAATQHGACVAVAARCAHPVEIFEDFDRQIAADAGSVLEGRRGKCALGRRVGQLARDLGETRQGLEQKEPIIGYTGGAAEALGAAEKAIHQLRLEPQLR